MVILPDMGKESLKGTDFYKSKGLVSVVIRIPKSLREKYRQKAIRQERSLQWVLLKVLLKNSPK